MLCARLIRATFETKNLVVCPKIELFLWKVNKTLCNFLRNWKINMCNNSCDTAVVDDKAQMKSWSVQHMRLMLDTLLDYRLPFVYLFFKENFVVPKASCLLKSPSLISPNEIPHLMRSHHVILKTKVDHHSFSTN